MELMGNLDFLEGQPRPLQRCLSGAKTKLPSFSSYKRAAVFSFPYSSPQVDLQSNALTQESKLEDHLQ